MLGRSLNVISLAGLAFATGMVVDNAIVVLENIYRHYQLGKKPLEAAIIGTTEVWGAVLASTLTTLAVFLPVVLVKEEAGQLFLDIALSISISIGLSLVVAMTMVPVATNVFFDEQTEHENSTDAQRDQSLWGRWLRWVLGPADQLASWFVQGVTEANRQILANTGLRIATVVLFVVGSAVLTWAFWPKVEYLPNGNRNLVLGIMLPPAGYNLDQMIAMGEEIEEEMRPYWDPDPAKINELEFPPIADFFFVARGRSVFVGTRAVNPTKAGRLVPLLAQVGRKQPGTFALASQSSLFAQGLVSGRSIDIEITGPEIERLVQLGGGIMGQVMNPDREKAILPGAMAQPVPSLDLSNPEVHVRAKLQQTAETRISNADLGYTVNAMIDGAYATDYYLDGQKIDLVIVGHPDAVHHSQDVAALPVATPTGDIANLGTIADITLSSGPEQINRRERQRAITIRVNPPEGLPLQEAVERIQEKIVRPLQAGDALEGGYRINLGGSADKLQATWAALRGNVLLAAVITYLLMAALFESWVYPVVIMLTVPLGAVGGILGMQVLNAWLGILGEMPQTLDVLTMLGFVILIGTVVNNPILIVDQSLIYIREHGMDPLAAIVETVKTRLRPIFSTATTTVLGLIPLVFFPGAGSELYRGLGAVVLGGIAISTVFTLFLVPSLFSLFIDLFGVGRPELPIPPIAGNSHLRDPQFIPGSGNENGNGHPADLVAAEAEAFRPNVPR
jgi:HAE1 family hydrophobic/amphiphilic exporter-1